MNRIDKKFKELKQRKQKALICFITAGDPNLKVTEMLVKSFEQTGVDIVELGVPFSDPLADGPTIQSASVRALKNRISLSGVLKFVKKIRRRIEVPLVLLTYYNPVFKLGIKRFVEQAVGAGTDGVIIPDLSPEDEPGLLSYARLKGLALILLLAPTSSQRRSKLIARNSEGFIYYVSLTGTTGARKRLSADMAKKVKAIKKITEKPVCVGFGLSKPQHIRTVAKIADGAIVGSALVKLIENNLHNPPRVLNQKVKKLVRRLKKATQC
jgi:tryptophan synthase alpha chain